MAKFFLYLGSFTGVITIFGTAAYFLIFKNDDQQPLVTVIQDISQEENNNHQEEIVNCQEENINEEKNNNFLFFDNVISIIILLLAFVIGFYLVYFTKISPVIKNNNNTDEKKMIYRSPFRKTGFFLGGIFDKRRYVFHEYYDEQGNKRQLKFKEKNDKGYEFEDYPNNKIVEEIFIEEKKYLTSQEKVIAEHNIANNCEKKNKIDTNFLINNRRRYRIPDDNAVIANLHLDLNQPSYQEFFDSFEGQKIDFFNSYNILAFLLSSLFFLLFFIILYFIFYFSYALLSVFLFLNQKEVEEENKFLIAFYRTLRALFLLNLWWFFKIIPFLLFLIVLLFNGVLFFKNENGFLKKILKINFLPIIYDISDPNAGKEIMNVYYDNNHNSDSIKDFFETGKIDIPINKNSYLL